MTTRIIYPLDEQIIKRCNTEMDTNSHKGNSWMNGQQTPLPFLLNKLQEEYSELVLAIKEDPYMVEKEGADLINIVSMILWRYRIMQK